jgi:catechol 2,3-dioxygenase-like lactoylglutathione lyase family enzyme
MLRIKDPKKSLKFYQEIIGMELLDQHSGGDFVRSHSIPPLFNLGILSFFPRFSSIDLVLFGLPSKG